VIELPAGVAGDLAGASGESLAAAANRKLHEETGYEAERRPPLLAGPNSAGITDGVITLFAATGLRKTALGGGEGAERITVHEWRYGTSRPGCTAELLPGPRWT
jgi:ADP-ribose pyrophosphatase